MKTTIEQLEKRTKAEQAKLNKARATRMEKKVAKYLSGNRVPMSGSGSIKGDCIVPYDEYRSIYVECKFTEKDFKSVPLEWLEKIEKDTKSMRCLFGILVVEFFRDKDLLVFFPERALSYIDLDISEYPARITTGSALRVTKAWKNLIITNGGVFWIAVTLEQFRECLVASQEALREEDETNPTTTSRKGTRSPYSPSH